METVSLFVHTDQQRALTLCPLWCARTQRWLVMEEAERLYQETFGALQQGENLQLWLDGRDVTHAPVVAVTQQGALVLKKSNSAHRLDLPWLARNTEGRRELLRTETAQFVMQRVAVGGAIGEANGTLPERHPGITQAILVLSGAAEVRLSSDARGEQVVERAHLTPLQLMVVPPNTYHYVRNIGSVDLVLFSMYAPPEGV